MKTVNLIQQSCRATIWMLIIGLMLCVSPSESFAKTRFIDMVTGFFAQDAHQLNMDDLKDKNKIKNYIKNRRNVANLNDNINKSNRKEKLQILDFKFSSLSRDLTGSPASSLSASVDELSQIEAKVEESYVFPNPFRQNSQIGGVLKYVLSKHMEITIHVYDMLGHLIVKQTRVSGSIGGQQGENLLAIDQHLLEGTPLSAGVYYFLLIHEGAVLSKGKMAVKP